jgi:hypothetical protein
MKREDGCVYCESVEQATPKSPRTEAKYQSQLKELEAEAAAMREALETIRNNPLLWKIPRICGQDKYAGLPPAMRKIDHALFFTAGKDLLDRLQKAEYKLADHGPKGHNYTNAQYVELRNRLQKAEAVVEAAKSVYAMAVNIGDFRNGNTCQGVDEGQEMANRQLDKLKQALDDLEGQY